MKHIIEKDSVKSILAKKIESLGDRLAKYCLDETKKSGCPDNQKGLNLMVVINKILDSIKKQIKDVNPEMLKKNTEAAQTLLKYKKITPDDYNEFIKKLNYKKQVYSENGEWLPVNKLNTNYSDISVLLADLLIDGDISLVQIYIPILYSKNKDEIVENIMYHKDDIQNLLIKRYKNNPEELFNYTSNIISATTNGDKTEELVKELLEKKGLIFEYQGGNGDFIDMLYSIDLMFKSKNGETETLWTIQVKSSYGEGKKFINSVKNNKDKYKALDLVIYPDDDYYVIHSLKSGKEQKIKKI